LNARPLVIATIAVAMLATGCTSSSNNPEPTTSVTSQPTPTHSVIATQSSPAPAPNDGPLAGGVDYLKAIRTLNATRDSALSRLGAAYQASKLQLAIAAVHTIRVAQYKFTVRVRALKVDKAAASNVSALLTATNQLIAELDRAANDATVASFAKDYSKFGKYGAREIAAEQLILIDLKIASDHPTEHLAPQDLPAAAIAATRPLNSETSQSAVTGYDSGGYRMTVVGKTGSALDNVTEPVNLADTRVTATVRLVGAATNGYVACRSTGTGTDTGTEYLLGIGSDGTYRIELVNVQQRQYNMLATGTSSVIHAGSEATNSIEGVCIGSYLTLIVNGKPIYQIYDASLSTGSVGVGASTSTGPGSTVVTAFNAFGTV
jgi:PBP1b-binding outer membrane lipoprotein LpoB